jgi:hypothetical protein
MGALERFFEYAQDFEKTYDDDDWSRLERYFAPDAVYEVRNASFGCRLEGPQAILRGLKRSLDGFDRRLVKRTIGIDGVPTEQGDTASLGWTATYTAPGAPPFVLRGRSTARYRGDLIVELVDAYPDGMDEEATAWARRYAPDLGLNPAYV